MSLLQSSLIVGWICYNNSASPKQLKYRSAGAPPTNCYKDEKSKYFIKNQTLVCLKIHIFEIRMEER